MLRQGWNKSCPGQGSLGGTWSPAGRHLLHGASLARGKVPPDDWGRLRDPAGSFRASSPLWRSPEQGRAEGLPAHVGDASRLRSGHPGSSLGVQWQNQGLGLYLKAAIASMAWYRTAVHSWSTGSFSSSSCRAEMGWDLTLVSGARGAPVTPAQHQNAEAPCVPLLRSQRYPQSPCPPLPLRVPVPGWLCPLPQPPLLSPHLDFLRQVIFTAEKSHSVTQARVIVASADGADALQEHHL